MLTFLKGNDVSRPLFRMLPYGMILLMSFAVYSGGFNNDFLINWDDPEYVTSNPHIQSITLENLHNIFTGYHLGTYAPVQMLSYMLDYALWGPNPLAFLLINVVLHALNALLFHRLLCRLQFSPGWALLAALLFTVHPVQVESVAWISQRKNVLAMSFFLLAFWQYLCFAEKSERRWRHYLLSIWFFLLALLTKSVVVVLPLILVSYDLLLRERGRSFRALVMEKLPFVLLALGGALTAVISQQPDYGGGRASGILGGSPCSATLTMLTVYKKYLFNLFWPLQLSAEYQVDVKHAIDSDVLTSAVLMAVSVLSVMLAGGLKRRSAIFWLSIFFIGFIPVSQIVPFKHLMNDRYLYFPMLGFAAWLAVLLNNGVDRVRILEKPVLFGSIIVLLLLATVSWRRTGVWANSITLWQDAVQKQPRSAQTWASLGNAYDISGDAKAAIDSYRRAIELDASDFESYYALGKIFLDNGELAPAGHFLRKALELKPNFDKALYNLGYVYLLTGQYEAAVASLKHGARVDPEGLDILMYLGAGYYGLGDLSAAWRVYDNVRQSDSRSEFPGMANVAMALIALRQGNPAVSSRLWQESMDSGFSAAEIYLNWARLEAIGRRRGESLAFLAKALSHGTRDLSGLYDDPVFASLRNDAEFIRMVKPQ